ncbi:hypothetical protein BN938_1140 [Mucinivorans hirudinis]|uniref:Calcineurin-like phosphoesterase domain-containing protein n=1 Tax=Mucinivorans hirudinis TaxID=1433126 RepID=A0A060R7K0_9BACT|nr:hypothetical protein BN938_1140 [Mucinivorans hirudinis]
MKRVLFILLLITVIAQAQERVRFLIFSDLHCDLIPDADIRLQQIMDKAAQEKVDFVVELGDFIFAKEGNRPLLEKTEGVELYHAMGNHDMDICTKEEYMNFVGMAAPYYSVDKGKFNLIFLDTNSFVDENGTEQDYANGNYYRSGITRERIGSKQLENLMIDPEKINLIFSHQPIVDPYSEAVVNDDVHNKLADLVSQGVKIVAFAGHTHSDNHRVVEGVNYIQINSSSYFWAGEKYADTTRYPSEVYAKYPSLKYVFPYQEPLYAIVTISDRGEIEIEGRSSKWIGTAPTQVETAHPLSNSIQSKKFSF